MEKINQWFEKFMSACKEHNVNAVISLFTDDVEYWETPFTKLNDIKKLKTEWEKNLK